MKSILQKLFLLAAGSAIAFVLYLGTSQLHGAKEAGKNTNLFDLCMNSTPGSSLGELKELFGEPTAIRTENSQTIYYEFGDEEYVLETSDEIRTTQDQSTGKMSRSPFFEHSFLN